MSINERGLRLGVFDSGVGGICVLNELRSAVPSIDLVYVADQAHCPYGDRSAKEIIDRAIACAEVLIADDVAAVVVACNTATVAAIEELRARFPIPFVGTRPPVKPPAASSETGTAGVCATSRTLDGAKFGRLIESHTDGVRVLTQPCPGVADRVEAGDLTGTETRRLLEGFVEPLLEGGADVIVLGSTHYVFLRPVISELVGPRVQVLDPIDGVVRRAAHVVAENGGGSGTSTGSISWWTKSPKADPAVFSLLSGEPVTLRVVG